MDVHGRLRRCDFAERASGWLSYLRRRDQIRNGILNGVGLVVIGAVKAALLDFSIHFSDDREIQFALAYRTHENIHQFTLHLPSPLVCRKG